ncbi:MAG: ABC transporter permease, partial [Candidatus Binatus sp.]|uniref:ABC transporter ATP-binding protein/permease n=1 Tax=Candidatus Binatus sp. TaxID=2811406 RepID=UPI003BAEF403
MSAVIQIEGLNKTYRMGEVEVQALRNVSLSVERGEFLAIMGASGSGKSTLMNIIGCLDRPTGGRYLLEGIHVASLKEEQLAAIRSSRIGFVFQTFNLLARTTAIENVELPLFYSERNLHGEQRAGELLEMLGLKGRENNNPNQLSGGQQQRVAIARSLINRPAILLADEPTGNLDSKNSAEIMEIISRLNREQGITVLVVTHDADVAAYTDRVVTFRDGAILSDVRTRAPAKAETLAAMSGSLEQAANGNGLNRTRKFGTMALSAAARALRRNKTRAALTMLGIFIGVAAVIAMVAVGNGARYSVQQQIQSLGTNLLVVLPGATTANGVRAGAGSISTLTVADGEAIQKEVLGAAAVSYADHQVAQVVYAHQNWSTSIAGTTPIYLTIRDWPVVDGRNFTDEEERSAAPVCLLGRTVVNNLYGPGEDPVGTVVRVKNFPLRVVGVLGVKGQSSFGTDQDDVVLLPFNTAERKVLGTSQVTASVPASSTGSTNPVLNP